MRLRIAWAALLIAPVVGPGCPGAKRDGADGATLRSAREPTGPVGPVGPETSPRPRPPVKHLEIDLSRQRLTAFEDGRPVREIPVSTGKRGKTPTGEFRIWRKHRLKDMKVGLPVRGDYYLLEDVPWVLYFANAEHPKERGLAIHGAWWHSDFGRPATHGCVNLPVEEARELFFWTDPPVGPFGEATATDANPGTRVVVFDSAARDAPQGREPPPSARRPQNVGR
ncbi:MAG: L,D-transpeptidase [Deltaproteobacteria bacterium]|nr:L,D-transpeptidase [Deltaproteobacteria bacterium]